jgi:Pretoxin HINT domain
VAGTLVLTTTGKKAIEELRPGDWVISWDEETGEVIERPVTEWFQRETSSIVDIFIGIEKISCTTDHPFWVQGKGWVLAFQLKAGTVLQNCKGESLIVDAVHRRNEVAQVYNVEIEGQHTYFVSGLEILSHNMCGDPSNRASFEKYVDDLRANMERPNATDPNLNGLLDNLYRPNATVGSGSTAAAVRQEAITGQSIGGRFHTQKAEDSIRALQRWLNNNPEAPTVDRAAAENVLRDLSNALGR